MSDHAQDDAAPATGIRFIQSFYPRLRCAHNWRDTAAPVAGGKNLYGRFSWLDSDTNPSNYYGNIGSPESGWSGGCSRSITLDDTYLLGGWVLHANAGYSYAAYPRAGAGSFAVGSLGFPASFVQQVQFRAAAVRLTDTERARVIQFALKLHY